MAGPKRFYLWQDDKIYGPYDIESLAGSLWPEAWVMEEDGEDWRQARTVPELEPVLSGKIPMPKDWYFTKEGGEEEGPYTRADIIVRIKAGHLGPEDRIRHANWDAPRTLGGMRLYRSAREGITDGSRFAPARVRNEVVPVSPGDPAWTVAGAVIIVLIVLFLAFIFAVGLPSSSATGGMEPPSSSSAAADSM